MADSTDWDADVMAVLHESAAEEVLETESAPDSDQSPENADPTTVAADENPPETVESAVEESTDETAPVAEQAAQVLTEPVAPNWDDDTNPYKAEARQLAQVRQLAQQLQQAQAEKLALEKMRALADDDPQRVTEIQQFLAQTQQPLLHQIQTKEQEVELAAKLATVYDEAVKFILTPEQQAQVHAEVERMMRLPGGPDYLQHDLSTRSQERSSYQKQLDAAQKRIAELERGTSVAAQVNDRVERKADLVESGSGVGQSLETRWDDASNFDEAFDVIAESIGLRRTA